MAFITALCEILEFYVRSYFNLCDLPSFLHMNRKNFLVLALAQLSSYILELVVAFCYDLRAGFVA